MILNPEPADPVESMCAWKLGTHRPFQFPHGAWNVRVGASLNTRLLAQQERYNTTVHSAGPCICTTSYSSVSGSPNNIPGELP